MNELIKKLAVQADMWCEQNVSLHAGTPLYNTIWEEKFAELIVKECALVLEQKAAFSKNGREAYLYGASLIEEHFGVEE